MQSKLNNWQAKNPDKLPSEAPWHTIVQNSVWGTFYGDFLRSAFAAFMAEGITVTYTWYLIYIFDYI